MWETLKLSAATNKQTNKHTDPPALSGYEETRLINSEIILLLLLYYWLLQFRVDGENEQRRGILNIRGNVTIQRTPPQLPTNSVQYSQMCNPSLY
jgi:hypothetical protein